MARTRSAVSSRSPRPTAREIVGTKLTVGGGELESLRGDLSHAGVVGGGRFGYRVNGGYYRSDTFTRSRTLVDGSSLATEYAPATDAPIGPAREARPLSGQTLDPVTRAPARRPGRSPEHLRLRPGSTTTRPAGR